MLYALVVLAHIIVCIVLILVILLQSGRGGGLSDLMGGQSQQTQKIFGAQTSSFMMKATTYCAIAFVITSIGLGILTSLRSKSLMEGARLEPVFGADAAKNLTPEKKAELEKMLNKAMDEAAAKAPAEAETAASQVAPQAGAPAAEVKEEAKAAAQEIQGAASKAVSGAAK